MSYFKAINRISAALEIQLVLPKQHYFTRATEDVAESLIGDFLIRIEKHNNLTQIVGGRIVETEAYLDATDPASHAATKQITNRNRIFYQAGGVAYVFRSYGIHHCFNIITEPANKAGCVLIRAIEPFIGLDVMAERRGKTVAQPHDLCSGPGKVCQALGINQAHTGFNIINSELLILRPQNPVQFKVKRGTRVGISTATERHLRFWQFGSNWTSHNERKGG